MLSVLEKMVDVRASYSAAHLLKTLLLLSDKKIGRHKLIAELGLNEASVKTILKNLEKNNIAEPFATGYQLTKKGAALAKRLKKKIPHISPMPENELMVGKCNTIVVVRNAAKKIKFGLEQRDAAIKAGADGATTLVCKNSRLVLPGVDMKVKEMEKMLGERFELENNDVVIIGSASSRHKSEEGALAAAMMTLG